MSQLTDEFLKKVPLNSFPQLFTKYVWGRRNNELDLGPDRHPCFEQINHLEKTFKKLEEFCINPDEKAVKTIKNMIIWAGGGRFHAASFEIDTSPQIVCTTFSELHEKLNKPNDAISYISGNRLPRVGLVYGSMILRFLDPENYGSFDRKIHQALVGLNLCNYPKTHNTNAYCAFIPMINDIKNRLNNPNNGYKRPECCLKSGSGNGWRAADVELAISAFAGKVGCSSVIN